MLVIFMGPIFTEGARAGEVFRDMKNHWADIAVGKLVELGILDGYEDGTFKPDNTITRAEFSKIIRTALKLELVEGNSFSDTENHWAENEIYTLVQKGIIDKSEYINFEPDKPITRIEMAKMIVRAVGADEQARNIAGIRVGFTDDNEIPSRDRGYIYIASKNGIIKGYPDKTFKPYGQATRAEASQMIVNMFDALDRGIKTDYETVEVDDSKYKEVEENEEIVEKVEELLEDGELSREEYYELREKQKQEILDNIDKYQLVDIKTAFPEPLIKVKHDYSKGRTILEVYIENIKEYGEHFTFKTVVDSKELNYLNYYEGYINKQGDTGIFRRDKVKKREELNSYGLIWLLDRYLYGTFEEHDKYQLYDDMEIPLKITITNTHTGESKDYYKKVSVKTMKYK